MKSCQKSVTTLLRRYPSRMNSPPKGNRMRAPNRSSSPPSRGEKIMLVSPTVENMPAVTPALRPKPFLKARNVTDALFLIPPSTMRLQNTKQKMTQP